MAQTKGQKLQSSKINNEFLNSLIIHFLTASACFLLCAYAYVFSSIQHLAPIFLPSVYSLFSNPKFLFFVVNVIVAFLVKESNMLEPPTSSPTNDMYDEYIKRSQRIRRASILHVQEKMDHNYKRVETTRVVTEKRSPKKCCGSGEKQRVHSKGGDSEVKSIQEVKEKVHCSSNRCKKVKGDEEEESGLSADELNKRADAFIARVNRQRLSEWLVCSKA